LTGVDVSSEAFRAQVSPLNTPADPNLIALARDASTSSVHLAMFVGAALLLIGALVNAIGIRNPVVIRPEQAVTPAEATAVSAH
jgi:hypothetical protein